MISLFASPSVGRSTVATDTPSRGSALVARLRRLATGGVVALVLGGLLSTGLTVGAQAAESTGAQLEVQVSGGGVPVEGVRVEVLSPQGSTYEFATSGYTDEQGVVELTDGYSLQAGVAYAVSLDTSEVPSSTYSGGYLTGLSGDIADDFDPTHAVVLGEGNNVVHAALNSGAEVGGDITAGEGLPFDQAWRAAAYRKQVDLETGSLVWKIEAEATLYEQTDYSIAGLRAGEYVVSFSQNRDSTLAENVYGDGYASAAAGPTTTISRGTPAVVNGRFVAGQTITGQITAPADFDIWNHEWDTANVSLFVFPANPDGSFDRSNTENINGRVNSDGTFETGSLVAGDYYIYFDSLTDDVSGEWYNNAASPANGQTIAAGGVTDLVELGTGFDLTVTAKLGTTPIAGARVDLVGTGWNNENYSEVLYTDANGTLVVPDLEADAYEIAVSSEETDFETRYATVDGQGSTTRGLVSGVDQPVSAGVTFPAPTVTTVTVVDPAGKPVAGAFVSAVAVENGVRKLGVSPDYSAGTTDKSGVTSFEVQPDTDYTLVTYGNPASIYAQYLGGLSISDGNLPDAETFNSSEVQNVTFAVAAPGRISGIVKSSAKKPLAGVQVEAYEFDGRDWELAGFAVTSKTGAYSIAAKPGSYKVGFATQRTANAAFVGDYLGTEADYNALATVYVGKNATVAVNKTLAPGGSLTGTITAGSQTYVTPIRIGGEQNTVMVGNATRASTTGVFTIVGLPAGTYALSFDSDTLGDSYTAAGTGPLYKVAAGKVTKIAAKIVLPSATSVKTAVVQGSVLPSISVDNSSYITFESSNGVHVDYAQFSADGQYRVSLVPGWYTYSAFVRSTSGVRYQPIYGSFLVGAGVTTVDLNATVNTPLAFRTAPHVSSEGYTIQPGGYVVARADWDHDRADVSYQWLRDGMPIFGARDYYYAFQGSDVGSDISVRMTLDTGLYPSEDSYETVTATSNAVTVAEGRTVSLWDQSLKANRTSPGGVAELDSNSVPYKWNLSFQWERDGVAIPGQTGSRYTFVLADIDATITATVTAHRLGYATSEPVTTSGLVGTRGAAATNVKKPVVTAVTKGVSAGGTKYSVTPGTWSIAGTTPAYAWYYDNEEAPFATTSSVIVAKDDPKQRAITVKVFAAKPGFENSAPVTVLARKGTAYAEGNVFVSAGVETVVEAGSPVMLGHALSVQPELSIPLGSVTHSYVWQRQTGTKWAAIAKATARTYVPTIADTGKNLRVILTASSPYYASKVFTVAAGTAVLDQRLREERAGSVVVAGTGAVSSTVSASFVTEGPFAITGVALAYQWGTLNGEAFVPIAKATAAKYVVPANLAGKSLSVRVTSTKAGFAPSVEYAPFIPVTTDITVLTTVSYTGQVGGEVRVGGKLTVKPAVTDVTGTVRAYQWQAGAGDGFSDIVGATASSYVPTADDVERDIRVIETISKAGSTTVTSTVTEDDTWTVEYGRATVKVPAKVTTTPAAYTVVAGSILPAATQVEYRWFVGGQIVEEGSSSLTRDSSYAGKIIKVEVISSVDGYEPLQQELYVQLAAAPVQTTPFQFSDPRVGQVITLVEPDLVFPAGSEETIGVKVQWYSGAVAIKGATMFGFVPTPALAGKKLSMKTTLSSKGFATKVYTSVSKTVALGAPAELGIVTSDEYIAAGSTISSLALSPAPGFAVTYQWFRVKSGETAVAIPKATKAAYTTLPTDAGSIVELRVTYKRAGYTTSTYTAGSTWVYGRDGLIATVAPKLSGSGAVGAPLTVTGGTWLNAPALTFQWMRNGVAIPGATAATYTPLGDHLGDTIGVEVHAKRVGFSTQVVETNEVKVTLGAAPRNIANGEPKITGSAVTCSTLKVSTGTWDLDGLGYSYQWMRSSALGGGPIAGATSSTYVSTADDQGYKLYVMVTVTRDGYAEGSNKTALTAAFTPGADCSQN